VSLPRNTKKYIYIFLGAPAPKGRRAIPHLTFSLAASCCRRYFPSRTSFEVDLALDSYCSSHHPTSDEKGRRCPAAKSSPLAPTRKNVFKSACRVEMLLAAVQVWTREWDDEPLLLNCSVACGIPCAAVVHGARQSDRRTRVQATASGQREPAGDLSSYLFAIFSDTTPITRKKEKNNHRPVRASRTPERW
jgi:hypothetical protein